MVCACPRRATRRPRRDRPHAGPAGAPPERCVRRSTLDPPSRTRAPEREACASRRRRAPRSAPGHQSPPGPDARGWSFPPASDEEDEDEESHARAARIGPACNRATNPPAPARGHVGQRIRNAAAGLGDGGTGVGDPTRGVRRATHVEVSTGARLRLTRIGRAILAIVAVAAGGARAAAAQREGAAAAHGARRGGWTGDVARGTGRARGGASGAGKGARRAIAAAGSTGRAAKVSGHAGRAGCLACGREGARKTGGAAG
jgi:hypothetical protein